MPKYLELPDLGITLGEGTPTHEILTVAVTVGERVMEIDMLKSKSLPAGKGDFLPASVRVRGEREKLWSFKALKDKGFTGLAKMFRLTPKCQPYVDLIGLTERRRGDDWLVAVIPLSELGGTELRNTSEFGLICFGGRYQCHELIGMKSQLASQERLECQKTPAEEALLETFHAAQEAEIREEKARRKAAILAENEKREAAIRAENERRETARLERRKTILARPQITVYDDCGRELRGLPVTKDEWPALTNGQYAILVDSYDQEQLRPGKPLEHFRVVKSTGGRAIKAEAKTGLSSEKPTVTVLVKTAESATIKVFKLEGKISTAMVLTQRQLDQAKKKGMNSGTLAAVEVEKAEGNFRIYRLTGGGKAERIDGTFTPLANTAA